MKKVFSIIKNMEAGMVKVKEDKSSEKKDD